MQYWRRGLSTDFGITPEERRRAEVSAVLVSLGAGVGVGLLAQRLGAQPLVAALGTGALIAAASVVLMQT
jgi:hypothetical protein